MVRRDVLVSVARAVILGALCVAAIPLASPGSALAACGTNEHVYLGANVGITNVGSTQSDIDMGIANYCSTANMYYYEAVASSNGNGYAQAGWGVGIGIGGPHAFDEYFDTNGNDHGIKLGQSLVTGTFYTFWSAVMSANGSTSLGYAESFLNGNFMHSANVDWTTGYQAHMLGESYNDGHHWSSIINNAKYCTQRATALTPCTPNTSYTMNKYATGDRYSCDPYTGSYEDEYDTRDNGGHC